MDPEPWLRGPLAGVHPLVMPVFFSFAQVREDLDRFVLPLSRNDVWCQVEGSSIGFHVKHMAGSVDRLSTYLVGQELTPEQLNALKQEHEGNESPADLLDGLDKALGEAESRLQSIDPASLYDSRTVGRKRLPTTVIGLLVHMAEHTQRHLGQAITLAKIVRQAAG